MRELVYRACGSWYIYRAGGSWYINRAGGSLYIEQMAGSILITLRCNRLLRTFFNYFNNFFNHCLSVLATPLSYIFYVINFDPQMAPPIRGKVPLATRHVIGGVPVYLVQYKAERRPLATRHVIGGVPVYLVQILGRTSSKKM